MRRQRGFTLMELMLAIAILAIVTTAALPAFTQFIQNNKLAGQSNEVVTAFQLARSEALRRGVGVRVCSSADGAACGGNWTEGWIAITDEPNPEVLRVWTATPSQMEFTPAGSSHLFEASGFADAAANLTIEADNCTGDNARRILLEPSGRVASERVDCT